ncbi:hypothetical protein ACLI1A_17785 [Flavobacterium sp. RHBU_3]|uniref:hypothetical protein n=1 Tax=Flavobacterium sp. RHBU_3 TaxID=3391184 RepID=UPI003984D0BC
MKTIIFLLSLIPCISYTQDLDYLKRQDTIFIVVEKPEKLNSTNDSFQKFNFTTASNGEIAEYIYQEKDAPNQIIIIRVKENPTTPVSDLNIKTNRKKFLKENHEKVVDQEFIQNFTPGEFFFNYLGLTASAPLKKVVYIIDENSLKRKDKNIILRKASIVAIGYIRM